MPSRIPDLEGIKKFKEYLDKKITFRDISFLMRNKETGKDKPLVTLWRWSKYIEAGILSTKKKKKVIHK